MDKIDDSLDSIIESNDMIEKVQQLMNQIGMFSLYHHIPLS